MNCPRFNCALAVAVWAIVAVLLFGARFCGVAPVPWALILSWWLAPLWLLPLYVVACVVWTMIEEFFWWIEESLERRRTRKRGERGLTRPVQGSGRPPFGNDATRTASNPAAGFSRGGQD